MRSTIHVPLSDTWATRHAAPTLAEREASGRPVLAETLDVAVAP